jgi:hypothetical protein
MGEPCATGDGEVVGSSVSEIMKSASDQLSAVTEETKRKVLAAAQRDVRLEREIARLDGEIAGADSRILELKSRILESDKNVKSKEMELAKLVVEHEATAGKAGYDAGHEE